MADKGKKQNSEQIDKDLCVDRISNLPLPLIYHILSLLPTQYVVRTCVLSRTWKNIWYSVPSVNFHTHGPDFIKFVDSVLFLRDASNIQKFHLIFSYGKDDGLWRVNWWLIHAVRHNVEVLNIEVKKLRPGALFFVPATHIFDCKSLQELRLSCSLICLPTLICVPALKTLELDSVNFKDGQVEQVLFSVSPSLETLVIKNCCFKHQELTISMPQLKKLVLKGSLPSTIDISAPNILSLKLSILNAVTIRFSGNVVSMVSACLKLKPASSETIKSLFMVLKYVRSLKLSYQFFRSFIVELQKDPSIQACIETPFYNMEWLKIGTSFNDSDIFVLNVLLQHSPKIKRIFLKNAGETGLYGANTKGCFEVGKVWYDYKLPHLKLVELRNFKGSEKEMKLVKFFLENALVLEKLIVTSSKASEAKEKTTSSGAGNTEKEMIKVGRKLLSYSRASSSVGILFM